MKSYNTLYYLLTVLLIMGALASMAQNSYGMLIISGVSMAFGLIFLIQFILQSGRKNLQDKTTTIEFLLLFVMSVIITFRTLQIYFPFIEWIFTFSGISLALIYFRRMIQHVNGYLSKNKLLTWLIGISYMSIVFFFLAMVLMTFSPRTARYAGILALVLMTLFVLGAILRNRLLVDGERISVFVLIAGFRDRFYLLLSLFFLFSLYTGLTTSGILPKLYSDNYPQAYYELVNQAETGREKPVDGKFRYEEFKKMYDQFVQRNIKEGNK